jgi:hypothetical protein
MITQLRNEEKEYIDNILSIGLEEVKVVPSFEISTISNATLPFQNNDYLSYSTSSINNNNFNNTSNKIANKNNNFDYNLRLINSCNSHVNCLNKIKKIEFNNGINTNIEYNNNNKYQKFVQKSLDMPQTPTLDYLNNKEREKENNINVSQKKDDNINEDKKNILNNYNNKTNDFDFNYKTELEKNNENNLIRGENESLNNNNKSKEKDNEYCFNNINQKKSDNIFLKDEKTKESNSILVIPLNIPNNREIIENALLNNQKNINKLNKQISGNNFSSSLNDKIDQNEKELSISTRQLIDKYIDLKISNYSRNSINNCDKQKEVDNIQLKEESSKNSQINILFSGNNSINDITKNSFLTNSNINEKSSNNSELLQIHDLSEINNHNINKNNDIFIDEKTNKKPKENTNNKINNNYYNANQKNKKYNPKSSALKKLHIILKNIYCKLNLNIIEKIG